jgi:hypothetical protein
VALLDRLKNNILERDMEDGEGGRVTFFNLSFSVFSSFDALAACRFSCFAVNYAISTTPRRDKADG